MSLKDTMYFILGWSSAIGLSLAVLLSVLIPRMADATKLGGEEDKKLVRHLSNPWLPKRVLTPIGQKVWLVRNYVAAIGLIATVICFFVDPSK